jgi:hypothetical protein
MDTDVLGFLIEMLVTSSYITATSVWRLRPWPTGPLPPLP